MKKTFKILAILIAVLFFTYLLGPRVSYKAVDADLVDLDLSVLEIDSFLSIQESAIKDLKPDNQARVIWNNPENKEATEYVILFLHGFSASPIEGNPVVPKIAKSIGANLFLARMEDSGRRSSESYINLTPAKMINKAKESLKIAELLGKKIIIISSSTGGTYSAYLAAYHPEIYALIMYSPNIDLADERTDLILGPWGDRMLDYMVPEEHMIHSHYSDQQKAYWNEVYHTNGLLALKYLLNETMNEDVFNKIHQSIFVACYYKNEVEQDHVVSISRMEEFYEQISTPEENKRFVRLSDAGHHVLCSSLFNQNTDVVYDHTMSFIKEVLKLPVTNEHTY